MAESGAGGGAGGGDGTSAAAGAGKPPRPTITLPPRSALESLFHGGGGGGISEVSPGPLSLVSSFFADDPESECRSFTQLLVGAMNSPASAARRPAGITEEKEKVMESGSEDGGTERGSGGSDGGGGSGLVRLGQNRPASLAVSQTQAFAIPPGLSPASLLDSPGFFSSGLGTFGVSHQEALAQVTAQPSHSQYCMLSQAEYPSTFVATSSSQHPIQEISTLKSNSTAYESAGVPHSDQISQPMAITVDKPADDGYNWRKYGQKMVKGSEYPRSYYKCSHSNCPVKKKVEHSLDGQITEIIYKGQHNHKRPVLNKRSKEDGIFHSGSNEITESVNNPTTSESASHGHLGNLRRSSGMTVATSSSKRDRESDYSAPQQLSGSCDREEASEIQKDGRDGHDADAKRMNVSVSSQTTSTEPKVVVQTTSEVDLLDDGYRWRKYGQKVVKGNPNPRSYYKCTYHGCNVRKHIERAATDPKAVVTTYEGKHNHDVPFARNSSHNMAGAGAASSTVQSNNQGFFRTTNFRNNDQRPVAVLQLKEEHEIT
ncbi:probable WRKY transcription factor 4 [Musa acuminata AAA Group]|uniref:probable WRKY transcription factor 4 n=1 Tax=Musa acuminata AAA Group TaxID=214697 RepID=UPI0031CF2ADE